MIPVLIYPSSDTYSTYSGTYAQSISSQNSIVDTIFETWKNQHLFWKDIPYTHPDVLFSSNSSETPSIAQIRLFCKEMAYQPHQLQKKLCVIWNIDLASNQAQNTLLKTLEEPPTYADIVLVVTKTQYILPTIHSRVIKHHIVIKNNNTINANIKQASNSKQINTNVVENNSENKNDAIIAHSFWHQKNISKTLEYAQYISKKYDRKELLHWLLQNTYQCRTNKKYPTRWHLDCIQILEKTYQAIEANGNIQLQLESGFLQLKKAASVY